MDIRTIFRKLRSFGKDKDGSEAIEMVVTTAMIMTLILVGLLVIMYVMEYNSVNFATKRVVREIETTGTINQSTMNDIFRRTIGSTSFLVNKQVAVVSADYISGTRKVELGDTFRIKGSAVYRIHLIRPGYFEGFSIDMPISVTITGMSEVHWPGARVY